MTTRFSPAIIAAAAAIESHPAVSHLLEGPTPIKGGRITISAEFIVPLPSRAAHNGISSSGVRSREPVTFTFTNEFPFKAPTIGLRNDFPRCFPHINPGRPDQNVNPCIYEGNLDELLHQTNGLNEIINQLSDWLTKAARNDLIDTNQGWEQIRRDGLESSLVFDEQKILSLTGNRGGFHFFVGCYLNIGDLYLGRITDFTKTIPNDDALIEIYNDVTPVGQGRITKCVGIIAWPSEYNHLQQPNVVGDYLPDTVSNLQQLYHRLSEFHCLDAQVHLNRLYTFFSNHNTAPNGTMPVCLIIAVRRPCNLIGKNHPIELIPYMINCSPMRNGVYKGWDLTSVVLPLGHRHAASIELLQRMSGSKGPLREGRVVQLGCGSLGSKISLHLARAGHGPFTLVDSKYLAPHNVARHALYGNQELFSKPKAKALKEAICSLGQKANAFKEDIVSHIVTHGLIGNIFTRDTKLIIDSTASLSVRELLSASTSQMLPGKLVHTSLYSAGSIGIMAIEGRDRNPRIDDIMTALFNLCIDDEPLRKGLCTSNDPFSRQQIGHGCGSYTMTIPDSCISMFASGFAEKCQDILEKGVGSAELWIGSKSSLGVNWRKVEMGGTILATPCEHDKGWEVRILDTAAADIKRDVDAFSPLETGGVLIGKISYARKTATIARILAPPADSIRSRTDFVLGTEGLRDIVRKVQDASGGTLGYLGTWHSHPSGGGASNKDHDTLERMKDLRLGLPTINLIWTPSGFLALVDDGEAYVG